MDKNNQKENTKLVKKELPPRLRENVVLDELECASSKNNLRHKFGADFCEEELQPRIRENVVLDELELASSKNNLRHKC